MLRASISNNSEDRVITFQISTISYKYSRKIFRSTEKRRSDYEMSLRWNHHTDNSRRLEFVGRGEKYRLRSCISSPCHFHRRFRSPFSNIKIIPFDRDNITYEHVRRDCRGINGSAVPPREITVAVSVEAEFEKVSCSSLQPVWTINVDERQIVRHLFPLDFCEAV